MKTRKETDWVTEIGQPAAESIAEMVAALKCDYGRVEELRDERDSHEDGAKAWAEANPDAAEELAELEKDAGDCKDQDEARQRIEEHPLSLLVRSDWHRLGEESEDAEFELLLGTGGPAVRIVGELQGGEPVEARLEVQDWFKPWTEYTPADEDTLLEYCRVFCFSA